jgi:hypothetical protein
MDRVQILLKEYEICHEDSNALASRFWSFANIFIPTNLALLGLLVSVMLTKTDISNAPFIVLFIGLAAIGILICVLLWLKRINHQHQFNYGRAHEIEFELGMWKNLRLHAIGSFKDDSFNTKSIPKDMASKLFEYHGLEWWQEKNSFFLRPNIGSRSVYAIFYILIVLWVAFIIYSFICY